MPEDPQRGARTRQHERATAVESILESIDPDLDEHAYPVNSHDFAAKYRASEFDVANETETLADAFDRIAERYDEFATAVEARAALTAELRRDEAFDEEFTDAPDVETE